MGKHDPKKPDGNPTGDGQWTEPLPKEPDPGKHAEPDKLSGFLIHQLSTDDQLSARWAEAMRAVPRHRFIPDLIYRHVPGAPGRTT